MPDPDKLPPGTHTAADLSAANMSAASRNMQAFAAEIGEMSRQSIEHFSNTMEKMRNARGLSEILAIQTSYMREALERFMVHARRFSEIVTAAPVEMSKGYTNAWSKSANTAIKTAEDATGDAMANAARIGQQVRDS